MWLALLSKNELQTIAYEKLHLRNLLVHLLHEVNDEVDQFVLEHFLGVEIGNKEGDVVALYRRQRNQSRYAMFTLTFTGFLRRMKKASALCVKNLVNLCTRISSMSSACLILILMRTLLTLGSIKTLSFSFRDIVNGFRRTSGELAASISGTLCLSDVWDAKLARANAAVREARTHWR